MSGVPTFPGFASQIILTQCLRVQVRTSRLEKGLPVVFPHDNASSPHDISDPVERFVPAVPKQQLLWVCGDSDQSLGDNSFLKTRGAQNVRKYFL